LRVSLTSQHIFAHLNVWFSTQTGAVYEDYYTSADLVIGAIVNVWGRKLVLCDCDTFTKEYYRTKFGIGMSRKPIC